jgi:hypothetical protein
VKKIAFGADEFGQSERSRDLPTEGEQSCIQRIGAGRWPEQSILWHCGAACLIDLLF